MSHFIEHSGNGQKIYDAMLLDSSSAGVLSSSIAMSVIAALSEENQCPMDVARKLGINEQKVYYYLRGLEKAGIVKKVGEEPRYGMTAKIYSVVSPVVAIKLHDKARVVPSSPANDVALIDFLHPFIEEGKLNAKIIFGDPYPHGEHDVGAKEGVHAFDLAMLIGSMVTKHDSPSYMIDTDVEDAHLKDNLILVGNIRTNTIIDKIKSHLPVYVDNEKITSRLSQKSYENPSTGAIMLLENPFDKSKKVMVISGIRTRGFRAAMLAIKKEPGKVNELLMSRKACIVEGYAKNNEKTISSTRILE